MVLRSSGILLHPTSLPGPFGIGDLGPEAYRFVDLLCSAGQHMWQMLPVNPTRGENNNSPYYCPSTFAGDPLMISPQLLRRQAWLKPSECSGTDDGPPHHIDFPTVRDIKMKLLAHACDRLLGSRRKQELSAFCHRHQAWLDTYALFTALNRHFRTSSWCDWPVALRDRDPEALKAVQKKFAREIAREKALQFFFFEQWHDLKTYCGDNAIRIIGDLPIYVPLHSADVWANPHCFKLGPDRRPLFVSGVPPDYFSVTGQLWGHPIYNWERMRETGYRWWMRRMMLSLSLYDLIRIDHFRGLVACWEVPSDADTALPGKWRKAPAEELLALMSRHFGDLPVIAEDLGTIDADVREVMEAYSLPGMRVLQFAFGDDFPESAFLPHRHIQNCVVYTGTHDNNTVLGWFRREAGIAEKHHFFDYLGREVSGEAAVWEMIRMAMQSVADTVIIPMQDLLGLDESARINHPARLEGNWRWRLSPGQLTDAPFHRLRDLTHIYGRDYPLAIGSFDPRFQ